MGFFDKLFGKKEKEQLDKGLEKTREGFFSRITKAIAGKSQVDDEVLDQLEEAMISADVGVDTTLAIIEKIQQRVAVTVLRGVIIALTHHIALLACQRITSSMTIAVE